MAVKWIIPALPQDVRRSAHLRSNTIAALHLVTRIALMVSAFVLTVQSLESRAYAAAVGLFVTLSFLWSFLGWAGLGHEFFHSSVFTSRRVNRIGFLLCSIVTWNNYGFFDYSHREHHRVTMFEGDPEGRGMIGIPVKSFAWLVLLDLPTASRKIGVLARNAFGNFAGRLEHQIRSQPGVQAGISRGARVTLTANVAIAAGLGFVWTPVASLVWLAAPFTFTFVNRILENAQHTNMQENVNDFRLNTRTVKLNSVLGLIYSNMHLHVEHHMFPKVPYYNLPIVHRYLHASDEWMPTPTNGFRDAMASVVAASNASRGCE